MNPAGESLLLHTAVGSGNSTGDPRRSCRGDSAGQYFYTHALGTILASKKWAVSTSEARRPGSGPLTPLEPLPAPALGGSRTPPLLCPPLLGTRGSHTHCLHQAVCAPLLVAGFVVEAAGDSQAGWCESPIGDARLVRVPGAAMQGRQAAIDLVRGLWLLRLDQGRVAGHPVPVRGCRWRGGPGPG